MSDEATVHVVTEEESPSHEAVHDAVTAAIAEADHREDVEEALEEIQEEQEAWQGAIQTLTSAQSVVLERMNRIEASLSQLMTEREAAVIMATSEPSSEMQRDDSSREADSGVEERVLAVEPESQTPPGGRADDRQSGNGSPARRSFYSPLRNLMQARKRHAG